MVEQTEHAPLQASSAGLAQSLVSKRSTASVQGATAMDTEGVIGHLRVLAKTHFGHQSLRANQVEALSLILTQEQVLLTLPTGSGKSLLYGLTSLLEKGVTIVVSPLTALKREQASLFRDAQIASAHLSFEQGFDERSDIWQQLSSGILKLLFVSPERFVSQAFVSRLQNLTHPVSRVFIDEAHCMASWGFDFRPEYRQVGRVIRSLGVKKVVAMTATASPKTKQLIKNIIAPSSAGGGGSCERVAELFSLPLRENVFVESVRVRSEKERQLWLSTVMKKTLAGRKMIVYVQRRKDAEELSLAFRGKNFKTVCYHAGLGSDARKILEEYVRETKEPLVVFATQAFGMGINLTQVDRVVVYGFPSGIEEMLQMMGRAGRGGQKAYGTLLWTGSDPIKRLYGIKKSFPSVQSLDRLLRAFHSTFGHASQALTAFEHLIPVTLDAMRSFLEKTLAQVAPDEVWLCESFVSVLRLNEAAVPVAVGQPQVVFFAENHHIVLSLHEALKGADSQRLRVLQCLCAELISCSSEPLDEPSIFLSKPLFDVQNESKLSLSQLDKVFADLNSRRGMQVRVVAAAQGAWVVAPSRVNHQLLLDQYKSQRDEKVLGFEVLDAFARSHSACRMRAVLKFLDGKTHSACGQCDLCLKNL